jgi:Flp pilus assembly protein TadD
VAYGLVRTGVIEVRAPTRRSSMGTRRESSGDAALHSARAHTRAGRHAAALDELRRASQRDPESHGILRALGYAAARTGDLALARTAWARYLEMMNGQPDTQPVRDALAALTMLTASLEADVDR